MYQPVKQCCCIVPFNRATLNPDHETREQVERACETADLGYQANGMFNRRRIDLN